ncbi:MAG: NADH-quinone oxidoreductase subunit NuoE [Alphaproteobacteria bacterium]|nr:NADH-quinone oxidoreductase subunit NuoE [Alphaproteobacteria bacterium]
MSPAQAKFEFTAANLAEAKKIIAKYPPGRQASAVMPLLTIAQKQNDNWLPQAALEYIAGLLGMAPIRVHEVASFYTMYNLAPAGRTQVQVCTTTPCWLRGSDAVVQACEKALGIKCGEVTKDGKFGLKEVECLGACVNAPMMQIGDDYYEDLDAASTTKVIEALKSGAKPAPGPQGGRKTSEPQGGPTTLTTLSFAEKP